MDQAIVTLTIGDKFQRMAELTHPTIKRYADRIGADFVVISERKWPEYHIDYEKFQFRNLLLKYDRIHFIDTDCIVREDCPNLFQIVKPTEFGAFCEGTFIPERMQALEYIAKLSGQQIQMNLNNWRGEYWNAGMMVISTLHQRLFTMLPTDSKVEGFGAQSWLNLLLINNKVAVKGIDYKFNRMTVMDAFTGEPRHASWIIHYAGCPMPEEFLLNTIREDLKVWESSAPEYKFKRNVCVQVGGGIGDVVDLEPVVRYVADVAYKGDNIFVATSLPRLYEHLSDRVVLALPGASSPISPMLTFNAFPKVEDTAAKHLSHTMNHVTDYSSLSFLRRTLTADERQIQLMPKQEEIDKLREIYDRLEDLVLVHAGAFWPSKTFPPEWWSEVITNLVQSGLPVGLIGCTISKEQGTVDIEIDGTIDFRNKTTIGEMVSLISKCRVVVSNDSSPGHIAGAFDCGIVLIPTCKHPEHIAPCRNRSQFWRQRWLYKKPMWECYDGRPTNFMGSMINIVPNGGIMQFLPEPSEVVSAVKELYQEVGTDRKPTVFDEKKIVEDRASLRNQFKFKSIRDHLGAILEERGYTKGIEIGVLKGEFSDKLLSYWPSGHLWMVDAWEHFDTGYIDTNNADEGGHLSNMNAARKAVEKYETRTTIIRGRSVETSSKFDDGFFDFIYLDANHSYQAVMADLDAWINKIRPGGLFAGHDYMDGIYTTGEFGVKSAINKFFGRPPDFVTDDEWPSWGYFIK